MKTILRFSIGGKTLNLSFVVPFHSCSALFGWELEKMVEETFGGSGSFVVKKYSECSPGKD